MKSRRDVLRLGLLGGGLAAWKAVRAQLGGSSSGVAPSPPTTPFVDRLPVPPALVEIGARRSTFAPGSFHDLSGDVRGDLDPRSSTRARFAEIVAEARRVKLHSQLPPTEVWGYRDASVPAGRWPFALGPTMVRRVNSPGAFDPSARFRGSVVRHVNQLPSPQDHRGFGEPITTVHLHGGHQPAIFDGFPSDIVLPDGRFFKATFQRGEHHDYYYPLVDPGFDEQAHESTDRPSTLWYHDHFLDFTGPNVYRGLIGFCIIFDPLDPQTGRDTGDETNAAGLPNALRLPSGEFDVPLALQEKTFDAAGQLVFDQFDFDGFLGDKPVVNSVVQPYLPVKGRKYRFRILNGSNARIYQLFLTDQSGKTHPFTQIATEGGLLSAPVERESFMIAMAERVEVVIDFSRFPAGTELFLENRLVQDEGRGPRGKFGEPELIDPGTRVLKFIVGSKVADPSRVPPQLRPFPTITQAQQGAALRRTFEFERSHGLWTINGLVANLRVPIATPRRDSAEIWRLVNKSGGWWHPVHIHSEFGRVLSRNGAPPFDGTGFDAGQSIERDGVAKKDTYLLGPNDEVEIYFVFRDYTGPFVFHCHNLEHEDHAMMARFDVI